MVRKLHFALTQEKASKEDKVKVSAKDASLDAGQAPPSLLPAPLRPVAPPYSRPPPRLITKQIHTQERSAEVKEGPQGYTLMRK